MSWILHHAQLPYQHNGSLPLAPPVSLLLRFTLTCEDLKQLNLHLNRAVILAGTLWHQHFISAVYFEIMVTRDEAVHFFSSCKIWSASITNNFSLFRCLLSIKHMNLQLELPDPTFSLHGKAAFCCVVCRFAGCSVCCSPSLPFLPLLTSHV